MSISDLPDRRWIEHEYLPKLDGRVLYVGAEFYTAHYPGLAVLATEFVFLDATDTAERHGGPTAIRADFCAHVPDRPYDHVSLYGLIGYGTDAERMPELIAHADHVLAPGGTLMLGPDQRPRQSDFPPHVWAQIDDEARKKLPVLSAPTAAHWEALFALAPLDRYSVLVQARDLPQIRSNYVWWGRKP